MQGDNCSNWEKSPSPAWQRQGGEVGRGCWEGFLEKMICKLTFGGKQGFAK